MSPWTAAHSLNTSQLRVAHAKDLACRASSSGRCMCPTVSTLCNQSVDISPSTQAPVLQTLSLDIQSRGWHEIQRLHRRGAMIALAAAAAPFRPHGYTIHGHVNEHQKASPSATVQQCACNGCGPELLSLRSLDLEATVPRGSGFLALLCSLFLPCWSSSFMSALFLFSVHCLSLSVCYVLRRSVNSIRGRVTFSSRPSITRTCTSQRPQTDSLNTRKHTNIHRRESR